MAEFCPIESIGPSGVSCGFKVDVDVISEVVEVADFEMDGTEAAQIMAGNEEGLAIATGEVTTLHRVTGILSSVACKQCGLCTEDFSITLESSRYVAPEEVPGLEKQYGQAVMEMSGARVRAAKCTSRNTFWSYASRLSTR